MDALQKLIDLLDKNDKMLKDIRTELDKIVGTKSELEKTDKAEDKEDTSTNTNTTLEYKIVYVWNYSK